MKTNQPHNISITMVSSTGDIQHQIVSVAEGAATPEELVWKAMYLGDGIEKLFDEMGKKALSGGKAPWDKK